MRGEADPDIGRPGLDGLFSDHITQAYVTKLLIGLNILVFLAMTMGGAGFWHTAGNIQLAWGANFGPATQDGEWWRLASAMFIHFGMLHLAFNMWALWDGGHLVERMYGHARFIGIYMVSGLGGNLLSLVMQGNEAISGGASGAIFGIYGALLACLLRERRNLHIEEFRWLFWGALAFSAVSIGLGFFITGIDNSAHIGGFVVGILSSVLLAPPRVGVDDKRQRLLAAGLLVLPVAVLIANIPEPKYRWSQEVEVRKEIAEFMREEQAIKRSWLDIIEESKRGGTTFDELAGQIDSTIGDRYEGSFEQLSRLPGDPALPSAPALENILQYVQSRRDQTRALAEELRAKPDDATQREEVTPPQASPEASPGPSR